VQAYHWRLAAFSAFAITGWSPWSHLASRPLDRYPYVVDNHIPSDVRAVGPAARISIQPMHQIASLLARFIRQVRSLPLDPSCCARTGSRHMTPSRRAARQRSMSMRVRVNPFGQVGQSPRRLNHERRARIGHLLSGALGRAVYVNGSLSSRTLDGDSVDHRADTARRIAPEKESTRGLRRQS